MTKYVWFGNFNSRNAEIIGISDIQYNAFSRMLDINQNITCLLQELNIDIQRRSKDCNRNNIGNILIEF